MKPEMNRVLVIDDEDAMRHMLRLVLEKEGYRVSEAGDGGAGLRLLEAEPFDVVLCDIRMPGMDGLAFLREMGLRKLFPTVIMMSAYGTIETAVDCMKRGAYDYVSKPFKPDEVVLVLKKAEERLLLRRENLRLKEELAKPGEREVVFRSAVMEKVFGLIQKAAGSSSPVLITGETGTGKELVARALHAGSERKKGPFVAVNCSAISSGLMDSELFGHGKGAFTGADRERQGLFAAAHGGTLFLDEIGELPLDLQPKLLRVLQEGEIRRVGETSPRRVDVRVLAATARNLAEEVEQGRFRDDLFYRLAVVELHIPPLRERREDIPLLAEHFVRKIAARERRPAPTISAEVLDALKNYLWPGNIRELENFMEKSMIFCRGSELDLASLPWEVRRQERHRADDLSLKKASMRLEKEFIRKALAVTGGNRTQAARLLEISLRGLLYKMKEYGID
jgi:DNA-binding NtrC family response regulator